MFSIRATVPYQLGKRGYNYYNVMSGFTVPYNITANFTSKPFALNRFKNHTFYIHVGTSTSMNCQINLEMYEGLGATSSFSLPIMTLSAGVGFYSSSFGGDSNILQGYVFNLCSLKIDVSAGANDFNIDSWYLMSQG